MKIIQSHICFIFLLVIFHSSILAQDGEIDLRINSQLYYQHLNKTSSIIPQKSINNFYNFLIDTLDLPFVDDFSVNKIKDLTPHAFDSSFIETSVFLFTVDGIYRDSLELMYDTTWYYISDTNTSQRDSFPNVPYKVVYYTNEIPSSTFYCWPSYSIDSVNNNYTITTYYTPDTILRNQYNTYYTIPDDNKSLWIGSDVFVNTTFGVNPPTIGVATFDGVDSIGMPYDLSNINSYGVADFLTSKPINLSKLPSDSIYLSFFYQPTGLGNEPEFKDSLVLEFYSPTDALWSSVWNRGGGPLEDFKQVMLPITQSNYLQKGFRFRFKNYATLSGSLDHWNIDYVRLDKDRNINDTIIDDVAFVAIPPSFIKNYTMMPWSHFKSSPDSFMVDSIVTKLNNLSDSNKFVYMKYSVYNDTLVDVSVLLSQTDVSRSEKFNQTHPVYISPTNFTFPTKDIQEPVTFKIIHNANTTPDINRNNDTACYYQVFDSYYAYDDGIAEKAYYVVGTNAKVAYKFTMYDGIIDTLRAIRISFPQINEDITSSYFQLTVWKNLYPEEKLYSQTVKPIYSDSLNGFHSYNLINPIEVSGTFYIGWQQIGKDKIYVGFDKNINNRNNIFNNTNGTWINATLDGSLTIRPAFDTIIPLITKIQENYSKQDEFQLFPNPADNLITILPPDILEEYTLTVSMYDIMGRKVWVDTFQKNDFINIDVSQYPKGVYFCQMNLNAFSKNTLQFITKKVVVIH